MLVLSRNEGETVVVDIGGGETVSITVVQIRGDKVRLGFNAPRHVPINREEVRLRIVEGRNEGTSEE